MEAPIEMSLNCKIGSRGVWIVCKIFIVTRVEKISKNYVRNALKCAQFSKNSAQKPYIIMRWCARKSAETLQEMRWNPLKFQKVQLFSFAPRLEPRALCLIYQLIHCAIENWNASHLIWIYNNKTFDMKSAEIM